MARTAFFLLGAVALTGCSSVYEIRATVIDGRLAFIPDDRAWLGPDCIRSISVSAVYSRSARPGERDDQNGLYWEQTFSMTSCENPFPVFYGSRLKGDPYDYPDNTNSVAAKPLKRGQVYEVHAVSGGSAYGGGKFRLSSDGKVINLPL